MVASNGNLGLLVLVGFVSVIGGLALAGLTDGLSGFTLALGGILLVFVAVALTRPVPDRSPE